MSKAALVDVDVVVVGAGLVGSVLSCVLAKSNKSLRIAVVEARAYKESRGGDSYKPVVAINERSKMLLDKCSLWKKISEYRYCPFTKMEVWDAQGTGRIRFDCDEIDTDSLGYIIENCVIHGAAVDAIWQEKNIQLFCPEEIIDFSDNFDWISVRLNKGTELRAKLLIGADGSSSRVRRQYAFQTSEWNYGHSAITTTVETQFPHRGAARQVFMESGPLALLPLENQQQGNYCSVVWSQETMAAEHLMSLEESEFCRNLSLSSEYCLGNVLSANNRTAIPLRQQRAIDYIGPRVALIGDAAHTIHPLAGQGVNLGFADIDVLVQEINHAADLGNDIGGNAALRRFQRRRKGNNLSMLLLVENLNNLFSSPQLSRRLLRNFGLGIVDNMPTLKRRLVRSAMGL